MRTVDFESPWTYDVSKVLDFVAEEATLTDLQCNTRLSKRGKNLVHVTDMLLDSVGEYDDVVYIDKTRLPLEW